MARECWARSLGGCGGGLSREHIISASQFSGDAITLRGLPWCPEPKTVGLASLVAKNLCRTHNSALSPCDQEAARLRHALTAFIERRLEAPVELDGRLVERWLLKTSINLYLSGARHDRRHVTDELVRHAFGLSIPARREGMFVVAHVAMDVESRDGEFEFATLVDPADKRPLVTQLKFHGWTLVYAFRGAPAVAHATRFGGANGRTHQVTLRWAPPHGDSDRVMELAFDPILGRLL